ncbi:MAG TPA: trypsin-like peptidase domain-containing protein, partial [Candidatus Paceibacterota bacterium]|nr:trypsin-like peptidase domain-containing protein [Candidatus Paceibacterota bacterium]
MTRAVLFNLFAISIFLIGAGLYVRYLESEPLPPSQPQEQLSAAGVSVGATSTAPVATSSVAAATTTVQATASPTGVVRKSNNKAIPSTSTTTEVARVQDPYSTPPESFAQINTDARAALVNILCEPQGGSSLNPISGSGVIIDPRGVILTNAHVAQYVLLSESPRVNLTCFVRTGSPATAEWSAAVLYIPPIWVSQHVSEILDQHPTGTGEHDYALLYITGSVNGAQLPPTFPSLPVDTRPAIGFPGDQVLVASYPAELIGGIAAQYDLYADTSVTTIKQLLTFGSGTPDVVSLGGVIEAQSGSSGGAVINMWGRLIAIVATTSGGTTTADRDLRGVALSYINTDLTAQSGVSLGVLLQ